MSRYSLSLILLGSGVSFGELVRRSAYFQQHAPELSRKAAYGVVFVFFVICFALGKLRPHWFKKPPSTLPNEQLNNGDVHTADVEWYIRHKWLAYILVFLVVFAALSRGLSAMTI